MFFFSILTISTWLLKKKYGVRINLHPAFFIPLITIGIIIIPLTFILVSSGMPYQNIGVEFIAFSMLCFQVGSLVFIDKTMNMKREKEIKFIDLNRTQKVHKLIVIIVIFSLIMALYEMLKYYNLALNISSILKLPKLNSNARYSEESVQVISRITFFLSMSEYVAMIFAGILLASKRRSFIVLLLIFGLTRAFISGSRAGFLFALFMFLASVVVTNIAIHGNKNLLFTWPNIRRILVLVVSFVLFFLVVQMTRGGVFELNRVYGILVYLNKWFFAYLPSFSYWLSTYDFSEFTCGSYTFAGVFDALNITTRKQGLYDPINVGNLTNTNIFTIYRGLLLDFNIGCFLLIFLLGSFCSWAYHNLIAQGKIEMFMIVFSVYAFFLWSHTVSLFNYNIIILSIFSSYIIIKISRFKIVMKRH